MLIARKDNLAPGGRCYHQQREIQAERSREPAEVFAEPCAHQDLAPRFLVPLAVVPSERAQRQETCPRRCRARSCWARARGVGRQPRASTPGRCAGLPGSLARISHLGVVAGPGPGASHGVASGICHVWPVMAASNGGEVAETYTCRWPPMLRMACGVAGGTNTSVP